MARPLLKKQPDGKLYTRLPRIEASIDAAVQLDLPEILARAQLRDRSLPEYLTSECLVHLIREYRRRGNDIAVNQLLPKLLDRCGRIISSVTVPGYVPNIQDLKEEVLGRFAELFAEDGIREDSTVLDFYEVSFGMAFRALRTTISREERARTQRFVDLPDQDSQGEDLSETEAVDRAAPKSRDTFSLEDPTLRLDLVNALYQLPKKEREAILLHHHFGYDIESEDTNKRTVASICGVSGRTIRSRLRAGTEKLEKIMEKKQ